LQVQRTGFSPVCTVSRFYYHHMAHVAILEGQNSIKTVTCFMQLWATGTNNKLTEVHI